MDYKNQNILENKTYNFEDDKISAVYFLWKDGVIVYIGKSKDLRHRIGIHRKSTKKFDYFTYINVELELLGEAELYWIYKILPEINISGMLSQRRYMERKYLDKFLEKCNCRRDYLELYYFIQFHHKKHTVTMSKEIVKMYKNKQIQ